MTDTTSSLLGFQICDSAGANIQGADERGLPQLVTAYPSFAIFAPALAGDLVARIGRNYLLQPIFAGDVENPLMVTAI